MISQEWRDMLADRIGRIEADYVLTHVIPLIARDVIDACAAIADGRVDKIMPNSWNCAAESIARLIRIDVPKALGMEVEK